eukprot:TRINITY_DN46_c0_g1_i2.p1 TRINITY_DN46_c0_g1~~TRINITY_DN46_c0_g1_i2.p1  ORF type:complete len:110 (-),score=3.25 TRINITY_DN46_c0_g1_i2:19-348(-)
MAKVFETKIMTGELINNDIFNDEVVLKITNISGKTICIANRDLSPVNFQVHCVKEYHSGSEEDEVTDIDFAEVSYKLKIPLVINLQCLFYLIINYINFNYTRFRQSNLF